MDKYVVFVTGGTGYIGSRVIPRLAQRGHTVIALVRKGSEAKLPTGCRAVLGDALDAATFVHETKGADTFVHLVGVSHPSPAKAAEFRRVDLVSVQQALAAATSNAIRHFVYLSVAQPAPVMKEYVAVRAEAERRIRESGISATFVRPWYVLGPGHRWAYALLPGYWVLEKIPSTCEPARRLGLVTIDQMVATLVHAVEHPAEGIRILDVSDIRRV